MTTDEKQLVVPPKKELVLEGDPEKQLEFAAKAASALMKVVKPKKINGKDYLEFGAWQTLGRFFGSTVGVEWTKPITNEKNEVIGYEARARVLQRGEEISSAEASCMRKERNWATRDEFAIKSMAQTRASAKALRNAFGWVAEMAGYASTPAEEMTYSQEEEYDTTPIRADAKVISTGDDTPGIVQKPAVLGGKGNAQTAETRKIREEIMKLLDEKSGEPFLNGADEYKNACKRLTNIDLLPVNYATVLERLRAI